MSESAPDRPPALRFAAALDVRRNAGVGALVGVAFAALVYLYRVAELLGPVRDTRGSPLLFLGLAFVLAFATAALVTVALTVRSAYRLAQES